MRLLDPLIKLWRDKVWGPRLRTYGEAREELGGVPWRKFTDTARWFLPSARNLPPVPQGNTGAITIDTGAIILAKPGLGSLLSKRSTWMIAGGAALMVVIALVASSGSKASAAAVVAPAPVTAPVAAAPAPAVAPAAAVPAVAAPIVASAPTVVKPVAASTAARPKMSASVRALLAGKSTRGVARPTRLKKVRRR